MCQSARKFIKRSRLNTWRSQVKSANFLVMTNEEVIREFSALPAEARREVEDFIRFLRQRYGSESEATADGGDLRAESFVGMWKDREDFADGSAAFVRKLRETEWTK